MKQYRNNTINRAQSVVAYLLLGCQLLVSCGGNKTLLSIDPNFQSTKTVHEQQTKCTDDNQLKLDTQPATLIDGTPLKMGQKEIQFAWDNENGLQVFGIDPSMGSMDSYVPIQKTPIIKDVNGKKISFNQLNQEQAKFIASGLKWGMNKTGELTYLGVRARGGMGKKGSDKGSVQGKGKDSGKGEVQDASKGSGKGVGQGKGKGVGDPQAPAKASSQSEGGAGANLSKASAKASSQSGTGAGVSSPKAPVKAPSQSGAYAGASSSKYPAKAISQSKTDAGAGSSKSANQPGTESGERLSKDLLSSACAAAIQEEQPGEPQDTILKDALYAAIQFMKHIPLGIYSSAHAYLATIKEEGKDIVEGPEPEPDTNEGGKDVVKDPKPAANKISLPIGSSQAYRKKTLETWKEALKLESRESMDEQMNKILQGYKEHFTISEDQVKGIRKGEIASFIEDIFFRHFLPDKDALKEKEYKNGKQRKGGKAEAKASKINEVFANHFGWVVKTSKLLVTGHEKGELSSNDDDMLVLFGAIDVSKRTIEFHDGERELDGADTVVYDGDGEEVTLTRQDLVLKSLTRKKVTKYHTGDCSNPYLYKIKGDSKLLNMGEKGLSLDDIKGFIFCDEVASSSQNNFYGTFFSQDKNWFKAFSQKAEPVGVEDINQIFAEKRLAIKVLALTTKLKQDYTLFRSSSRSPSVTAHSRSSKSSGVQTRQFLECFEDSADCIYFDTDRFFNKLESKNSTRFLQIQSAFAELRGQHNNDREGGNKICGKVLLICSGLENPLSLNITSTYKKEGRLTKDVLLLTDILRQKKKINAEKLKGYEQDQKRLKSKVGTINMSEYMEKKITDHLKQIFTGENINDFKDKVLDKNYTTIIDLVNNERKLYQCFNVPWSQWGSNETLDEDDREQKVKQKVKQKECLAQLVDMIVKNNPDFSKIEAEEKNLLEEIAAIKVNERTLGQLLSLPDGQLAVERGHSESVLLEYSKFDSLEQLIGKSITKVYILLLSTNILCSVCTNIMSNIKSTIIDLLTEGKEPASKEELSSKTILLYLPFLNQRLVPESNVFVKLNSNRGLYSNQSDELISNSVQAPLIIVFDKNYQNMPDGIRPRQAYGLFRSIPIDNR